MGQSAVYQYLNISLLLEHSNTFRFSTVKILILKLHCTLVTIIYLTSSSYFPYCSLVIFIVARYILECVLLLFIYLF